MTKQEKQKQKNSSTNGQGRTSTGIPQRPGNQARSERPGNHPRLAKVAVKTIPQPDTLIERAETQPLVEVPAQPQPQPIEIPRGMRRRQLLIGGAGLAASLVGLGGWYWVQAGHRVNVGFGSNTGNESRSGDQVVVRWNETALQAIRDVQPDMPVAARALAIMHTAMFDAWAAYDATALGTRLGAGLRRPSNEWTQENKQQAISYAAYIALLDLFPSEQASFQKTLRAFGYDPQQRSKDMGTPAGVGNLAAQAVLDFRHNDGSNQLGNLIFGAYGDYTHYQPLNTLTTLKDPNRWQPLRINDPRVGLRDQQFRCAQWGNVTPFALTSAIQFVPRTGPARYPASLYTTQAQQIIQYSANLTDEQKVIAEYWGNGPKQEEPAGQWSLFAQFISQRDKHTLDQNVKLFFALGNAMLDASIACWATKRAYDSETPVDAVRYLYKGKQIRAWAGAGKDVQFMNAQYWLPYLPLSLSAPGPEYCSEQSAFGAAAAAILRNFTGSDRLETSYTWRAGTSKVEASVPATNVTLSWETFTDAANQAGMAGRYGGIHFAQSDLDGRTMGKRVGEEVWRKAQGYVSGHGSS